MNKGWRIRLCLESFIQFSYHKRKCDNVVGLHYLSPSMIGLLVFLRSTTVTRRFAYIRLMTELSVIPAPAYLSPRLRSIAHKPPGDKRRVPVRDQNDISCSILPERSVNWVSSLTTSELWFFVLLQSFLECLWPLMNSSTANFGNSSLDASTTVWTLDGNRKQQSF